MVRAGSCASLKRQVIENVERLGRLGRLRRHALGRAERRGDGQAALARPARAHACVENRFFSTNEPARGRGRRPLGPGAAAPPAAVHRGPRLHHHRGLGPHRGAAQPARRHRDVPEPQPLARARPRPRAIQSKGAVRWEMDPDGEVRTKLDGEDERARLHLRAASSAASTSTRDCPPTSARRSSRPTSTWAPSPEEPHDRHADQHERPPEDLHAAARELLQGPRPVLLHQDLGPGRVRRVPVVPDPGRRYAARGARRGLLVRPRDRARAARRRAARGAQATAGQAREHRPQQPPRRQENAR
ncbi:MAG: hypothetical protein MZV63_31765 [Marinilabiliales bacterium]|nr:hypothetical protein [Marinilabiliales bacterium]